MSGNVVALTATTHLIDGRPRVRLNEAYVAAVRAAGLVPLVLPPVTEREVAEILGAVAGVVLTGGEDVDPGIYGADAAPQTETAHAARDACELAVARLAHERRVPTLAICRGIQVANVAFGGTLVQDIETECPTALAHERSNQRNERVHEVQVDPASALAQALGTERLTVNSSHHQALARVADGLRVTSRAPDQIIEGAEWVADDWWMLGVQWHPEELTRTPESWDRALFGAFAARVRAGRG
jgi:putative glutamine amidotransferase